MHNNMQVKRQFIEKIKNKDFKNRFISEFQRVTHWIENRCDLHHANIYDFGCGDGVAALSFALNCPNATVYGSDIAKGINEKITKSMRQELDINTFPNNLHLSEMESGKVIDKLGEIDLIYSWSVFEHIRRDKILGILTQLKNLLRKGGLFYLQINPLYYSSRGAHLYTHVSDSWCHLIHQHDVLKELVFASGLRRQEYDWEQYETLNRITSDELMILFESAGFKLIHEQRIESDREPPKNLLNIYKRDVLVTDEIMALFTV
ncbi:MAG: class I SAM-dependent methyltransferase [Cocleimonas sp.]|nr:class I SAM-dependent methyltransferase [Cocleimonas sp.]